VYNYMYHPHPHTRMHTYGAKMGSALYYIKTGSSEMAIDIVWNLQFDKTGNRCAMRCSDVSEVRQRGMECFSAGYIREVSVLQCQRSPHDGRRVWLERKEMAFANLVNTLLSRCQAGEWDIYNTVYIYIYTKPPWNIRTKKLSTPSRQPWLQDGR
jgi:hypothetical protein